MSAYCVQYPEYKDRKQSHCPRGARSLAGRYKQKSFQRRLYVLQYIFFHLGDDSKQHVKTEIKQEGLLEEACRMTRKGQVEYTQTPGEEGAAGMGRDIAWGGLWPRSLFLMEAKADVNWRRLVQRAVCGMQAPESACECFKDVRNGESNGLTVNLKRKK